MARFQGRVRPTQRISHRVTQSIFYGFDYAAHHGRPLNVYAVVNLHETDRKSAVSIVEDIRHRFNGWFRRATKKLFGTALPPFYAYSIENPANNPHCNLAVNIPPALRQDFDRKLTQWVTRAQKSCDRFDVDVQDIQPGTDKGVANYIVKGTDPNYIDHFHLRTLYDQHGLQGLVYGKRAGLSEALDKAARRGGNFKKRRRGVSIRLDGAQPIVQPSGYAPIRTTPAAA